MKCAVLAVAVGLALLAPGLTGDNADATKKKLKNVTRTDTVAQGSDDFANAELVVISGEPFAFAKVGKLRRLTQLTITATLFDGDTGPGENDENQLTLVLDGSIRGSR